MADVTISSEEIPFDNNVPDEDVFVEMIIKKAFYGPEGTPYNASDPNPQASPQTLKRRWPCTTDATHIITPNITAPPTENGGDGTGGRLQFRLITASGKVIGGFAGLRECRLPPTPNPTTFLAIKLFNGDFLPPSVGWNVDVTGSLHAASLTVSGPTTHTGAVVNDGPVTNNEDVLNLTDVHTVGDDLVDGNRTTNGNSLTVGEHRVTGALYAASFNPTGAQVFPSTVSVGESLAVTEGADIGGDMGVGGDVDVAGSVQAGGNISGDKIIGDLSDASGLPGSRDGDNFTSFHTEDNNTRKVNKDGSNPGGYMDDMHGTNLLRRTKSTHTEEKTPTQPKAFTIAQLEAMVDVPVGAYSRRSDGPYRGLVRKFEQGWRKEGREVVDAREFAVYPTSDDDSEPGIAEMIAQAPSHSILYFPVGWQMGLGAGLVIDDNSKKGLIWEGGGAYHPSPTNEPTAFVALADGIHMFKYDVGAARFRGFYLLLKDPNNSDPASGADSGIFVHGTAGEGDFHCEDVYFHHGGARATAAGFRIGTNAGTNCENMTWERCNWTMGGSMNPYETTGGLERGQAIKIEGNPNALLLRLIDCWIYNAAVGFNGETNAGSWFLERTHFTGCTWPFIMEGSISPSRIVGCRSEVCRHIAKLGAGQYVMESNNWSAFEAQANDDEGHAPATHWFEVGGNCELTMIGNQIPVGYAADGEHLYFRKSQGVMPENFRLIAMGNGWSHYDWAKWGINPNMQLDLNERGIGHLVYGNEGTTANENQLTAGARTLVKNTVTGAYEMKNLLQWDEFNRKYMLGSSGLDLQVKSAISSGLVFRAPDGSLKRLYVGNDNTVVVAPVS